MRGRDAGTKAGKHFLLHFTGESEPHAPVSAGANVPYRTGRKLAHLSAFSMTPMGHLVPKLFLLFPEIC